MMRWLTIVGVALLGLVTGAILGYTAVFFAYLWVHPPAPARGMFTQANGVSLGGSVVGALAGLIAGVRLGLRLTVPRETAERREESR